ncbi:amidohydrolase [Bosea caraganae]|uniref:Amidohydrolase n=1 Tax=Bosea caraganae TaxID=2763117 RepID=A0A370KZ78_9HYPH|nr:amidohydrolase family protein [Bosea caraganae]RDJ20300.1 amidohydrolase [Bosea caraganae]RDJ23997.1 amidohydrolase [Bosea caraganae]
MTDISTGDHGTTPSQEQLARGEELVLEPELPIIDPHHHLWATPARYLLDELLADTGSGHNIRATVYLQCRSMYRQDGPPELASLGETEFVNGVAAMSASGLYGNTRHCAGIVGYVDLSLGGRASTVLEAHLRAANGRLRGIRNSSAWHRDPSIRPMPYVAPKEMLLNPKFREGFAHLAPLGLSFDVWTWWTQLSELVDLADQFETTSIVLDHFGGIVGVGEHDGKLAHDFPLWRSAIREVARRPNITVKLGGLAMQTAGFKLSERSTPASSEQLEDLWRPYFDVCIEAFGPQRCMFESNFPVDKAGGVSYRTLWNAFKRLAAGAGTEEKAALFFDTAARVYRLNVKPI